MRHNKDPVAMRHDEMDSNNNNIGADQAGL